MIRFYLDDKSPTEELVYSIDWAKFLGQDTLVSPDTPLAEVTEGSATLDTLSNPDDHTTNFWVRGGEKGEVVRGLIHVETTAHQDLDAEVVFGIR